MPLVVIVVVLQHLVMLEETTAKTEWVNEIPRIDKVRWVQKILTSVHPASTGHVRARHCWPLTQLLFQLPLIGFGFSDAPSHLYETVYSFVCQSLGPCDQPVSFLLFYSCSFVLFYFWFSSSIVLSVSIFLLFGASSSSFFFLSYPFLLYFTLVYATHLYMIV